MINYFQPLIEQYYFINIIPDIEIFGFQGHFYFYLLLLLGLGAFLVKKNRSPDLRQLKCARPGFAQIILLLWFITILPWFITQARWLVNDIDDFYGKPTSQRQSMAVTKVVKNYGLSENWHDFYDFVMFGKDRVPKGSKIYILPANPVFQNFARYYLYPEMFVTNISETADYVLSFNVDLPGDLIDFETLHQLGLNKFILKQSGG